MSVRSLPRQNVTPDVPNVRYVLFNENFGIICKKETHVRHL